MNHVVTRVVFLQAIKNEAQWYLDPIPSVPTAWATAADPALAAMYTTTIIDRAAWIPTPSPSWSFLVAAGDKTRRGVAAEMFS